MLDRIDLGVRADIIAPAIARCDSCGCVLLTLKAGGLDRFVQQRLVLAGQAVARAERVEAVLELVLVDQGRERADLFELIGRSASRCRRSARSQPQS